MKMQWRVWKLVTAGLLLAVLGSSGVVARAVARQSWVGTWATPSVQTEAHRSFVHETLRQLLHTSIGGTHARIRISNLFGKRPLLVEDVHLARSEGGSSIVSGSDHALYFHGKTSVTIPPGATAVSDPARFRVPPLSDVAVSMYLPGPTGAPTFNPSAHQTNYIAPGDVSGKASLPQASTTGSWYYLTNLDVRGRGLRGAVVTLGASITNGYKATDNTNQRWPDLLAKRLAAAHLKIGVLNEGISGNRLLHYRAGPSAESRFDWDVLKQPGVRWVIFSDDPINDLGSTHPQPSAGALIAGIRKLIVEAHRHHIEFFCATLTPYKGAGYWNPSGEAAREKINAFIRGWNSGCDAVVDEAKATRDPVHPERYLPSYDSGDHLHPNNAGMRALANTVNLQMFIALWRPKGNLPDQAEGGKRRRM